MTLLARIDQRSSIFPPGTEVLIHAAVAQHVYRVSNFLANSVRFVRLLKLIANTNYSPEDLF
jgi:hypothetical protein